jgi:hypothetical protein
VYLPALYSTGKLLFAIDIVSDHIVQRVLISAHELSTVLVPIAFRLSESEPETRIRWPRFTSVSSALSIVTLLGLASVLFHPSRPYRAGQSATRIASTRIHILGSTSRCPVYFLANTLTQLLCTAGVNRLTTRVPALTMTLVLVVRNKAVSLVLSVMLFDGSESHSG